MRALLLGFLFATVALSGCFADDGGDDDGDTGDDPDTSVGGNNTTEPDVSRGSGTVTVSATGAALSQGGLTFEVAEGARVLFAELQWDDPVADLNLGLASPSSGSAAGETNFDHSADGGAPGSPDSPHSLTIETPEVGTWQGGALANGAAASVEYTIVATVFYDTDQVPDGYTALE